MMLNDSWLTDCTPTNFQRKHIPIEMYDTEATNRNTGHPNQDSNYGISAVPLYWHEPLHNHTNTYNSTQSVTTYPLPELNEALHH